MKRFLIAGAASGVGKTTITIAIEAAFCRRGLVVQPFKCGPDYLDTAHHTRVCRRPCRNLDSVMLSPLENARSLRRAAQAADLVIAEGMMGLFDGVSGASEQGSSAQIAKMLGMPVVLVLDASSCSRSIAATVLGFTTFDKDLTFAGIILNQVAGEAHFEMLAEAIRGIVGAPPLLGWFPRNQQWAIPERHLGLHDANERAWNEQELKSLADAAERHVNLDQLLQAASVGELQSCEAEPGSPLAYADESPVRIGIARDAAFSFYYEDNLDLLRDCNAELVEFSPIHDPHLPASLDALYFGGGYPELHGAALTANRGMIEDVQRFCNSGGPVYAECGGMMYLAREILYDGTAHAMTGVLPLEIEMSPRLVKFGYVAANFTSSCVLGPAGTEAIGHSFHYSRIRAGGDAQTVYALRYVRSGKCEPEGYATPNVLGSYVHLHFRSNRQLAPNFVEYARRVRGENDNAPIR
jgi:cobyrinic acid a,c-diamide synthase